MLGEREDVQGRQAALGADRAGLPAWKELPATTAADLLGRRSRLPELREGMPAGGALGQFSPSLVLSTASWSRSAVCLMALLNSLSASSMVWPRSSMAMSYSSI